MLLYIVNIFIILIIDIWFIKVRDCFDRQTLEMKDQE